MIFKILKIVISGIILSVPLLAAQNNCNTAEITGVTPDKKTKLCHIALTLNGIDCLSSNSNTVRKSEYHILHFLSLMQELAVEENHRSSSAYTLWKKGVFLSYYSTKLVERESDTHVWCISPSDTRKIDFPSFLVNINIDSEIERLLLDHPACLFASEFLKEYYEDVPCLPPAFREYTDKIKSEVNAKKQLSYLYDMLDEIVQGLKKIIRNEKRIINYGMLSYFVKITPINTKCWKIEPKRPKVLNFDNFDLEVDEHLPMMLHCYGIDLPR